MHMWGSILFMKHACTQEPRMGGNPLVQGYFGFSRTVGTSEHSLIKI